MDENRQHPPPLRKFLDHEDEKVVICERTHWILPLFSSLMTVLFGLPFYLALYIALISSFLTVSLLTIGYLLLSLVLFALVTRIIIDWYFHFYLVTNKKILEVSYSPFFSYKTNGVLLEQVRCTEIDEQKQGIIHELLDIGNITITFDRPTHEEEFTLFHLEHSTHIAIQLRNLFSSMNTDGMQSIWYRHKKDINLKSIFTRGWKGRYV